MSLNDIQLPASVITDLYRTSLVETSEPLLKTATRADTVIAQEPGKYLGDNQKNILVVVDDISAVYLSDEDLAFLTSMLTACRLSVADVAIVNRSSYRDIAYKEAMTRFRSKIVFLFAVDPVSFGLPVDFPHFQVQSFANTTFLFAPSLGECKKDGLLKSKLWVCLRRIFGI